jgi:hypothetical protein
MYSAAAFEAKQASFCGLFGSRQPGGVEGAAERLGVQHELRRLFV